MTIPPPYRLTKNIVSLLNQLEKLKTTLDLLPVNKKLEAYQRKKSILKSALYSARIEGNPLTEADINSRNAPPKDKLESANLSRSIEFVLKPSWKQPLALDDLKRLHRLTLSGLSGSAGFLRQEPSAIFNSAGIAVYVCPSPAEIKTLLKKLLSYINRKTLDPIPVKALLSHLVFEKIHPFLDGNGRVGRLLIHLILKKWHWDLRGLASFEQYLDRYRQQYYDLLSTAGLDATKFVEFFLESLRWSVKQAIKVKKTAAPAKLSPEQNLPPRRSEILNIIRDHRQISFDFLHRRFAAISPRLLRYDLKKLQDAGLVKKLGVTRGAVYISSKINR